MKKELGWCVTVISLLALGLSGCGREIAKSNTQAKAEAEESQVFEELSSTLNSSRGAFGGAGGISGFTSALQGLLAQGKIKSPFIQGGTASGAFGGLSQILNLIKSGKATSSSSLATQLFNGSSAATNPFTNLLGLLTQAQPLLGKISPQYGQATGGLLSILPSVSQYINSLKGGLK